MSARLAQLLLLGASSSPVAATEVTWKPPIIPVEIAYGSTGWNVRASAGLHIPFLGTFSVNESVWQSSAEAPDVIYRDREVVHERDVVRHDQVIRYVQKYPSLVVIVGSDERYYALRDGVKYDWKVDHGEVLVDGQHVTITINPDYWSEKLAKQAEEYEAAAEAERTAQAAKRAVLAGGLQRAKQALLEVVPPLPRVDLDAPAIGCPDWEDDRNVWVFGGYFTSAAQYVGAREVWECRDVQAYTKGAHDEAMAVVSAYTAMRVPLQVAVVDIDDAVASAAVVGEAGRVSRNSPKNAHWADEVKVGNKAWGKCAPMFACSLPARRRSTTILTTGTSA